MSPEQWAANGFAIVPDVLSADDCEAIATRLTALGEGSPGTRQLMRQAWCRTLAQQLRQHPALGALVPVDHIAVQATFFDKPASCNWLVPYHQDLSIPVAERVGADELQGWSEKEGALFVQPPIEVLSRLVAVRLHLDPCGPDDGPLRVIPGSHVHGRLAAGMIGTARAGAEEVVCTAGPGDVMVMAPLLLHASSKSKGSGRRRVLHYLFGPPELPFGLRWSTSSMAMACGGLISRLTAARPPVGRCRVRRP